MRLLLDTHVWLWSLLEPERLSSSEHSALTEVSNELWLSPLSIWETLMLHERGRIELPQTAEAWIAGVLRDVPFREAPLSHQVAVQSRRVRLAHQDPADRFIAATAIVYDLVLVTADVRLLASPDVPVLGR